MKEYLSFNDVLIVPKFSSVKSRKDVSLESKFMDLNLSLPVISSNMDTITEIKMARAMKESGAVGCLHRFMTIEQNVSMYLESPADTLVSVGVGDKELDRFAALLDNKASNFVVDVAHGANEDVVKHVKAMRALGGEYFKLMVGNFATGQTINDFLYYLGDNCVDAFKVGIGGGSACLTRVVTGCGLPTLGSVMDCVNATHIPIIADGGCRNSGDIAKALAAGAKAVFLGGMLSGTEESCAEAYDERQKLTLTQYLDFCVHEWSSGYKDKMNKDDYLNHMQKQFLTTHKKYRGSASAESYQAQGKTASHRAPEGDSFLVPYKGSVANVLRDINGGLRSALSYVGARDLVEFKEFAEFAKVTSHGAEESHSHGKR